MHHTFETPEPTSLYVELGSGSVTVRAASVAHTTVDLSGKDAGEVTVEQRGDQIVVLAPQRRTGLFGSSQDVDIDVELPTDSDLGAKLGSADLVGSGRLGAVRVKCGSGDVTLDELTGETLIESGSGDIDIESARGPLRVKSGSGDIEVDRVEAATSISTGSGSVEIGTAGDDVQVKSGSGDLELNDAHGNVTLSTASGDLTVGRMRHGQVQAKNVSGDIRVGIPAGVPVWTDISCVTGQVSSSLDGAGEPEEGQEFIEVRAKTVSGDISLEQL